MKKPTVIAPLAVRTGTNSDTGDVILWLKHPDSSELAIRLSPELTAVVLSELVRTCANSQNTETRMALHPLTADSVTAHVLEGIPTLRCELACGIFLQQSIDRQSSVEISRVFADPCGVPLEVQKPQAGAAK